MIELPALESNTLFCVCSRDSSRNMKNVQRFVGPLVFRGLGVHAT